MVGFRKRRQWACAAVCLLLAALTAYARPARAAAPRWLPLAVIYCVCTSIFSPQGTFDGVTAQLPRIKSLGATVVWLMPVNPIGVAYDGHPSVDSPYCVRNYYGVNPSYGTPADLHQLIDRAHALGLKVILDEVLNHTAWDNPLTTQDPQFYMHSDGNPDNPNSIVQAFNYSDVAQLDYHDKILWTYMDRMLAYWVRQYHVDGFRCDSADNPHGPNRMIPAAFWAHEGANLRRIEPNVLMLGECETADLALHPFNLDYGWHMYGALKGASNGGDAADVERTWRWQTDTFPAGMLHMSVQDDWDYPRDVNTFGDGPAGALAAAAFDFTINGVPLIYNGMEIGNSAQAVNPHATIDWERVNPPFPPFYHQIIALRHANPALQQGSLTWIATSAPRQLVAYAREGAGKQFLIEINLSSAPVSGTAHVPAGGGWVEVTPYGSPGGRAHGNPAALNLKAKDFAIWERQAEPAPATRHPPGQ